VPSHAKHTKVDRDTKMIAGLREHAATLKSMNVGPGMTSPEAVASKYEQHLLSMSDARKKEIAWRIAVDRERALEAEIKALHPRVQDYLRGTFGSKSANLRRFGVQPGKAPEIPVSVKLQAIERRLETRKLRRTMGKKQRLRIKGKL
jgi:hypothetical protein